MMETIVAIVALVILCGFFIGESVSSIRERIAKRREKHEGEVNYQLKLEQEKLLRQTLERQARMINREGNRKIDQLAREYKRRQQ